MSCEFPDCDCCESAAEDRGEIARLRADVARLTAERDAVRALAERLAGRADQAVYREDTATIRLAAKKAQLDMLRAERDRLLDEMIHWQQLSREHQSARVEAEGQRDEARHQLSDVLSARDGLQSMLTQQGRELERAKEELAEKDAEFLRFGEAHEKAMAQVLDEANDHAERLALLQAWARECGTSELPHMLVTRLRNNRAILDEKRCDRIAFLDGERKRLEKKLASVRSEATIERIVRALGYWKTPTEWAQCELTRPEIERRVRKALGMEEGLK